LKPISQRALELLKLVDAATQWEGDERPGPKLARFYVPRVGDGVYGPEDAASFRALERRGLIKPMPKTGRYSYAITEDGARGVGEALERMTFLFVGEKRSPLARKMNWRWTDGRLAAKQLFEALRCCGIEPESQRFCNWFERGQRSVESDAQAEGIPIVALGRKVAVALRERRIPHTVMIHPAARRAIRLKARYAEHVRSVLVPLMEVA
jgi:hypothetical protein